MVASHTDRGRQPRLLTKDIMSTKAPRCLARCFSFRHSFMTECRYRIPLLWLVWQRLWGWIILPLMCCFLLFVFALGIKGGIAIVALFTILLFGIVVVFIIRNIYGMVSSVWVGDVGIKFQTLGGTRTIPIASIREIKEERTVMKDMVSSFRFVDPIYNAVAGEYAEQRVVYTDKNWKTKWIVLTSAIIDYDIMISSIYNLIDDARKKGIIE